VQVLGLPFNATINPVNDCIDYCEVYDDLLSVEAKEGMGVRKTPLGEDIKAVLPLYITPDHWVRALAHLPAVLRVLTPGSCPSSRVAPKARRRLI
jgi:hypothetical protein